MSLSYGEFFNAGGVLGDFGDELLSDLAASAFRAEAAASAGQTPQPQSQRQRSNAAQGGGARTAGTALGVDFVELLGSREQRVPLSFSLQLGKAYTVGHEWMRQLGAALETALRREWEAVGGSSPLQLDGSAPVVMPSAIKGGLCTCTIHVMVEQEAAQKLRGLMHAGLGGVWVKMDGAPRAVLAHIHEQLNTPTYLFTLTTDSHRYSPAGLQRFIQKQQRLFRGMRVVWMGCTDGSARFIEQRSTAAGELLPQCHCPIPLPPFTVVGLAVGGQRVLTQPVEVRHGAAAEIFRFRRVPNRVRHLAHVVEAATSSPPPASTQSASQHIPEQNAPPPRRQPPQPQPQPQQPQPQPQQQQQQKGLRKGKKDKQQLASATQQAQGSSGAQRKGKGGKELPAEHATRQQPKRGATKKKAAEEE